MNILKFMENTPDSVRDKFAHKADPALSATEM